MRGRGSVDLPLSGDRRRHVQLRPQHRVCVLRPQAEVILSSVPKNSPEYSDAHRLLKFLHYFLPISDKDIPNTSIMREFLGKL